MSRAAATVMETLLRSTLCLLLVLGFTTFAFAAGPAVSAPAQKAKCPACGMFTGMFASWNAKITFKDSSQAVFDGAKCMFKYYLEVKKYDPSRSRDDITRISVKDYDSKEDIDARQAFYVIWSDVYGPMGHEPIPFMDEAGAERFLREHKGKEVLRFREITTTLITSLDNPP